MQYAPTTLNKAVSVLLGDLNAEFDYSKLENIDNTYIPFKFFVDPLYKDCINDILKIANTYIYLPIITKGNYLELIKNNLDTILSSFNVKGIVVSNLSQLELVRNKNIEIIGNYTLNVFNSLSASLLNDLGIGKTTLSPELNLDLINNICVTPSPTKEFIVYGKLILMNIGNCVIGSVLDCNTKNLKCKNGKFKLKDRLGFEFEVKSDPVDCISNIYNSKITSIKSSDLNVDSIRIDILDENIDEINNIVKVHKSGEKLEGQIYTNGNLYKDV